MATIEDSTDPKDTKRRNKDLILVSVHMFKLVIAAERSSKICFPSTVRPNNVYGIISLFFINNVLNMLVKNINKYRAFYYQYLKAPWKDTLVAELRVYLGILIYRSLYSQPKRQDYWTIDINKLIYESLASSISSKYFG